MRVQGEEMSALASVMTKMQSVLLDYLRSIRFVPTPLIFGAIRGQPRAISCGSEFGNPMHGTSPQGGRIYMLCLYLPLVSLHLRQRL